VSAYPTPLTPQTIQPAMQTVTAVALGLIPVPNTPAPPIPQAVYNTVRVGWQRRGQPFNAASDEIVYLRCDTVDDPPVNRVRNRVLVANPADANTPPQTLVLLTSYTRVWQTYWEFYGPQLAFDRARQFESALYTQQVHDTFAALGLALYWIPDAPTPRRVPYYSDGEWWERTDFEARFNEFVTEALVIPAMASVEVKVYEGAAGLIDDFDVELNPVVEEGYGEGDYGIGFYGD
jgi:hypothetical protein